MEQLPSKTGRTFSPNTEAVPSAMLQALTTMSDCLADKSVIWLVGGSCGALLQGAELQAIPRDLDVYVDVEQARAAHEALAAYATDEQTYSETERYGSMLSHYRIEGIDVELVGSLRVRLPGADYTVRVRELLASYARSGTIGGRTIRFMPLSHELVFNVLREREDRYLPLAQTMRREAEEHIACMNRLLAGSRIGPIYTGRLNRLFGFSGESAEGGAEDA